MLPVYSTAQNNTPSGFHTWRAVMNDTFFQMGCNTDSRGQEFEGAISQLAVGSAGLYSIGSEPVHYERSMDDIRRNPSTACQVFLTLAGQVHVSQGDRQTVVGPGQICVYDTGAPFRLNTPERYQSLVLVMPRATLEAHLPHLAQLTARTLGNGGGLSHLVGQLMRETSALDDSVGGTALARLGAPITEMVALALENELLGPAKFNTRHEQLLERVKAVMRAQMDNPDINIQQLASDLGIGIRTLNRLFAAEGTTAMHWLWRQRLVASHQQLVEGRAQRVADVALTHGFSSLSHFIRAFKAEFGVQPNSLLKSAMPGRSAPKDRLATA
jgi:AraC family transcriptional activator of tynA and feaB